jgi:hypothetical protein
MKFDRKAVVERHIYRSVLVHESPTEDWPAEMLFHQKIIGGKLDNFAFIGASGR